MLLAELSGACACSASSSSARLTRAWQSSNEPATRNAVMLSPKQPSWCAWRGETRPSGYSTTTRNPGWPWNAAATAAPVSPEVATRMVSGRSCGLRSRGQAGGEEARAEILERGGRAVEQLEHVVVRRRQRQQRRGEVEGFAADRRQFVRQRVAGEERSDESRGGVGQVAAEFQRTRGSAALRARTGRRRARGRRRWPG